MNRREFLNRVSAGAAACAASAVLQPIETRAQGASSIPSTPNGATRPLRIVKRSIEVNGKSADVLGIVQPDGAPGLTLDAGGSLDIALSNEIGAPTLIHWHGLTPPWPMDGVPGNPAALLQSSETRRYAFPTGAGGTHWMHAHTLQEQSLLAAPLIVRTAADRARDGQEVVILLHDFSFTPPEELLARLKGDSADGGKAGKNMGAMSMGGMDHAAMMKRMNMPPEAMAKMMEAHSSSGAAMPGMGKMDVNDIDYDAYLANDRTLDDPQIVTVEKGGSVRLRIINGATATAFTIDTGRLDAALIAVDGQDVAPVSGRAFPISMGQRLDLRLRIPRDGGALPILALREGAMERAGVMLASSGAPIGKIGVSGETRGPILGLDLESGLQPAQPLAMRPAAWRFALTLTGDMAAYNWTIDGADALRVRQGDRVEVSISNMSMMAHPMHLHGHHFQVVGVNGAPVTGAVRDTILIPPMASVTIAFDADNPGRWPLHCHHLYHMATGMMSFVDYV